MLDDGASFQLIPWQPALEKRIGQHITGARPRQRWYRRELRQATGTRLRCLCYYGPCAPPWYVLCSSRCQPTRQCSAPWDLHRCRWRAAGSGSYRRTAAKPSPFPGGICRL
ncbi:hypothetical protein NKH99_30360 [Mesorhizobium sp. M0854]